MKPYTIVAERTRIPGETIVSFEWGESPSSTWIAARDHRLEAEGMDEHELCLIAIFAGHHEDLSGDVSEGG